MKGIKDIESANKYLLNEYLDKHNVKFSKPVEKDNDMHTPLLPDQDLRTLICYEVTRSVGNDFVVRNVIIIN